MDVSKILEELRQEREQLEEAILSLERLALGRGWRRGRAPSWMVEAKKGGRPRGEARKTLRKPSRSVNPRPRRPPPDRRCLNRGCFNNVQGANACRAVAWGGAP